MSADFDLFADSLKEIGEKEVRREAARNPEFADWLIDNAGYYFTNGDTPDGNDLHNDREFDILEVEGEMRRRAQRLFRAIYTPDATTSYRTAFTAVRRWLHLVERHKQLVSARVEYMLPIPRLAEIWQMPESEVREIIGDVFKPESSAP